MAAVLEKAKRLMVTNLDVESVVFELGTSRGTANPPTAYTSNDNDLVAFVTEQSRKLSLAPSIVATRMFCSRLISVSSSDTNAIDELVSLGLRLQDHQLIDYGCLIQSIQKEFSHITLYILWKLSQTQLLDLKDIFTCITEHQLLQVCQFLTNQVIEYTTQSPDPSPDLSPDPSPDPSPYPSPSLNYRNQLITEFATLIYDLITDEAEYARATIIKDALLYPIIDGSYTDSSIQSDSFYSILDVFSSSVGLTSKGNVCSIILHHYTTQSPLTTAIECFPRQIKFQYSSLPVSRSRLFSTISNALGPSLSWQTITGFLHQNQRLNWPSVFSFVSCFVQLHSCSIDLEDCIRKIIESTITGDAPTFDEGILYGAIALARQASLEGTHIFPTYCSWFKQVFGDVSRSIVQNKKTLGFLLKCLTDCLPYDPPYCLKAHLQSPPRKLHKCNLMVSEYLQLVRARLDELNEPLNDAGAQSGSNHRNLALADKDVKEVLELYEKDMCHAIPSRVIEMNIFNQPYFLGRFLKSLLVPRKTPAIPDVRAKLINAMTQKQLISQKCLKKYHDECRIVTIENRDLMAAASDISSIYDPLMIDLQRVVRHIHDNKESFQIILSQTGASITSVIKECTRNTSTDNLSESTLDFLSSNLQEWQIEICNRIIICLDQCVLKLLTDAKSISSCLFTPIKMLIEMLSGHVTLHKGLISRLWELLHTQVVEFSDEQLLSFAVLLTILYTSHTSCLSIAIRRQCSLFEEPISSSMKSSITTSSDYSVFLLTSLTFNTTSEAICTGKILCQFFHHLNITRNNDVNASNDEYLIEALVKLKHFHQRIEFFLKNCQTTTSTATAVVSVEYKAFKDLSEMIHCVLQQSFIQGLSSRCHPKNNLNKILQFEFSVLSTSDYLTPLQRHAFRRHLLANPELECGSFESLFKFLVVLNSSARCSTSCGYSSRIPYCWFHENVYTTHPAVVPFNEGIQLLQELSSSGLFNTTHPLQFLLEFNPVTTKLCREDQMLPPPPQWSSLNTNTSNSIINCLLALPPHILYTSSLSVPPSNELFIKTVQLLYQVACRVYCHGVVLPFNLTFHLVKGIHQLNLMNTQWKEGFQYMVDHCPIYLGSLLFWWEGMKQYIQVDNLYPLFSTIDHTASEIQKGAIRSSSLLFTHCEAAAICTAGLISAFRLRNLPPVTFLMNISANVSAKSWNKQFNIFLLECFVQILLSDSSSFLEQVGLNSSGSSSGCNQITNLITHILDSDTSVWIVLLHEKHKKEGGWGMYHQLEAFREALPIRPVSYYSVLLIHILIFCSHNTLKKLINEDGFLRAFFTIHKHVLTSDATASSDDLSNEVFVSVQFLKSCSSLVNFIIQNASKVNLRECLQVCHNGLRLYIEDWISNCV